MSDEFSTSQELLRDWLDKILDAAINGDFKTCRIYEKKIRKLALEDRKLLVS